VQIGYLFIGKPYKSGALECPDQEKLIVRLSDFDCTTLIETVVALSRCVYSNTLTPSGFKKNLTYIRYRNGKIKDYSSRLHYFTDWLSDNVKKKVLTDISRHLGARPQRKKINFMSSHPDLYPALKNPKQLLKIKKVEESLSRRIVYIIDQDKIATQTAYIQDGDIIAFASRREGLDVEHVGIAVRQGGKLHFIHASQQEGTVVVSKRHW